MNRQEYINQVRKEVHFVFDREAIENELQHHLEDSICDLMEEGISREEAEAQAVAQMGDPVEVGKQLNEEHHPVLGYMWMLSSILLIENSSGVTDIGSMLLIEPLTNNLPLPST